LKDGQATLKTRTLELASMALVAWRWISGKLTKSLKLLLLILAQLLSKLDVKVKTVEIMTLLILTVELKVSVINLDVISLLTVSA